MAQINLLPWREERRQELKKQFVVTTVLFVALLGLASPSSRSSVSIFPDLP